MSENVIQEKSDHADLRYSNAKFDYNILFLVLNFQLGGYYKFKRKIP